MSFSNPQHTKVVQKTKKYHNELISLFNSDIPKSALVGNIVGPLLYGYVLNGSIPTYLLQTWIMFSIAIGIMRIAVSKMYTKNSNNDKYLNVTLLVTTLGGGVWGIATILTFIYAQDMYLYFTTSAVLAMIGGANTTLTPIYKAYVYYALSATLPLIVVFLLKDESIYQMSSIIVISFLVFVLSGGKKHYNKLRETIELKDKLRFLNQDLEYEVKKRTVELEILNNTLEEKVKDEIEKNRSKDQKLLEQSRMAQMGEMISMIAHQWRQPLGAIAASSIDLKMKIAFSSFDLDKKEGQEECTTYFDEQLNQIEEYVQGLTTTIDDFRNFYKPNKEAKEALINEPIQKSLSIIEASAKANGIEINSRFASQKVLKIYDSELMQVFLNIIKNAQDNFAEKDISNPFIDIFTFDTEKGVKVEITDNGGGIPENIIEKIFDPYFSTKDEKNGTGLGLYMSKTIIEEHHNGKIEVCNKDAGVSFSIEIFEA